MAGIVLVGGAFAAGAGAAYVAYSRFNRTLKRESFIRQFVFPNAVLQAVKKTYPHLEEKHLYLTAHALRSYFLVNLRAGSNVVGMPSRVVDVLWHEFILDTKAYQAFCSNAFGEFFHHIPAGNNNYRHSRNDGLRLTWRLACLEENIDPRKATRLPLLFAIDAKLNIPDGKVYDLETVKQAPRADSSSCGGFGCSGSSDTHGHHGDGGGDSSCSGDGGCGGGCGGD